MEGSIKVNFPPVSLKVNLPFFSRRTDRQTNADKQMQKSALESTKCDDIKHVLAEFF